MIILLFPLFGSCGALINCQERINDRIISQEIEGVVVEKYIEQNKKFPYIGVKNYKGNYIFKYVQLERDTLNSIYGQVSIGDSLYKRKGGDTIFIYYNNKLISVYDVRNECPEYRASVHPPHSSGLLN